ncbi:phosphotransferase family protein [Clostridium cellulovorans]|uniref:Aminoglycoside phosphotransferase n=1 Tax=Clostridium cellulovorans (strain ATCC 35296 / DSM 3052 / OCM 3 / 743B) TaxID=573061 RepID=D9SU88_CLOC7|nr:aminoglycoside phosphotransferase family protein [Clostridium cellulovorans]ADL52843.1 aminoglycoside phosphotransferase [Clostridium cellulovorans 743B]
MKTSTKNMFSAELIVTLVHKHFPNAEITEIRELKGGTFNTVYLIEGSKSLSKGLILKTGPNASAQVTEHEKDILRTEVYVYKLLEDVQIPVPKVYAHDFSRAEVPCDYFFMEQVVGTVWFEHWTIKQPTLMRELGQYTAALHSVKGDWFGYINDDENGRFNTWGKAFTAMMNSALTDAEQQGIRLPHTEIRRAVYSRMEILDAVHTPSLVNFDMWAGNIFLVKKKRFHISGVIDFERSFFGDPLASFSSALMLYEDVEKEPDFISGYSEISGKPLVINNNDRAKIALYQILMYVRSICETHRYGFVMRLSQRWYCYYAIKSLLRKLSRVPLQEDKNTIPQYIIDTKLNKKERNL